MSVASAQRDQADEEGVILSPDEEVELERAIAEGDDDVRAGRCVTWQQFLAERALRRGR